MGTYNGRGQTMEEVRQRIRTDNGRGQTMEGQIIDEDKQ